MSKPWSIACASTEWRTPNAVRLPTRLVEKLKMDEIMLNGTIKTHGHTSREGKLDLHLDVGLPDTDVVVVAHVRPVPDASDLDENGWPKNFFETVAGSMLELRRWDQGNFEHRLPLE